VPTWSQTRILDSPIRSRYTDLAILALGGGEVSWVTMNEFPVLAPHALSRPRQETGKLHLSVHIQQFYYQ
jgi:hypothetical protein